jgi:aminoglycoside 2'-N-acetyltransferase I
VTLRLAHTSALAAVEVAAARALLYAVFDDMTEPDWEHSLGGLHALVHDGPALVAHGAVVQRRVLHGGRALRCGYVEGVAVRPDRQRQGLGTAVMAALEEVVRGAYDLGALGATDEAVRLYASRGWQPWRGPLSALTPAGVVATPDEAGAVFVLAGAVPLDLGGELTCDWRDGDVW